MTRGRRRWISSLRALSGLTELSASCATLDPTGPRVLDRLDPYFSGEDSLASNKAGAFLP
jgi:hypothetical protein